MNPERWDLALIPCTASKHLTGITPITLYKGGPFSLMMRHAQQRADQILIMSAKYGLLGLGDSVSWYDKYLGNLSPQEHARLVVRLRGQIDPGWSGGRVLSYLPKVYFETLLEANPAVVGAFHRPYRKLPSLRLFKVLSNEIKNYGQSPSRR